MPALLSFQNKPLHLLHVFRQIEQVNRAGKSSRPNRAGESSEREGGGYGPYTYGCGAWGVRGGGGVCKEDEACTEESNETRKSVMETHGVETHTGQYGCTHGVEWDPPHTGTGGALGGTHAIRRMRGTTQACGGMVGEDKRRQTRLCAVGERWEKFESQHTVWVPQK